MTVYQAFSGGAQGADTAWEVEARKLGLPITFTHYLPAHANLLSEENKLVVRKAIIEACKSMGRLWPTNSLAYIQRNYLIARSCDNMLAIGTIQDPETKPLLRGGTGWDMQFVIHMNKPLTVFNQLDEEWYYYSPQDGFFWKLSEENSQRTTVWGKPALIGARELSKAGLAAIQQVLTQTKERNASYQQRRETAHPLPPV